MRSRSSALSWLVFSDSDIQDARRFIDDLDTSDATVDTLGLGVVLESLSEIFFPASSTLHRKIRYQIFIPALIWSLQARRQPLVDARLALKKIEYELQRALVGSGEKEGVIGRTRKEFLKYWPSLLYWNATNKLKMFGKDTAYSMDEVFLILERRGESITNDDNETETSSSTIDSEAITFDLELVAIAEALFDKKTGKIRNPVTFELTKPEAAYLKRKFQDLFPESLTFYLLDRTSRALERTESLFKLTTSDPKLNELIRQAEFFSRFSMGATYAYRWVLCEHLRAHAPNATSQQNYAVFRDHAEAHFARWRDESPQVVNWSYAELIKAAAAFGIELDDPKLEALQSQVLAAARLKGPTRQSLYSLKKFLRVHEFQIKHNSSRFENSNISIPKNVFQKDFGGNTLFDYRWSIVGKSNALSIVNALERTK